MKYYCPLVPGQLYHVYNQAVGSELLFRQPENYDYFLLLLEKYISSVAEIYAYNLLPDHFHILLKIKSTKELRPLYCKKYAKKFLSQNLWHKMVMQYFSNFFNAYAKAYNKRFERKGALFQDYFKRFEIQESEQFCDWVHYIHYNAVQHKLVREINDWQWSSYNSAFADPSIKLEKNVVLQNFNDTQHFLEFHNNIPQLTGDVTECL